MVALYIHQVCISQIHCGYLITYVIFGETEAIPYAKFHLTKVIYCVIPNNPFMLSNKNRVN